MKIAILGAGALGCTIGAAFARSGHDVVLLNRNAAIVNAINTQGLIVQTPDGERAISIRAVLSANGEQPVDLVIVLVKSFHTAQAMHDALSLVGEETIVLSLQNGLGHEDILAEIVGRGRVLAGKTYVGGVMVAPGRIISGIDGKETIIGELDGGDSVRVKKLATMFNAVGLLTSVSENMTGAMWDKLVINVATGALSAITRLGYGDMYKIAAIEEIAVAAVQEAIDVAPRKWRAFEHRQPQRRVDESRSGVALRI